MNKPEYGYYNGIKMQPTPSIGDRVLWYPFASQENIPVAADVVAVEAPGRVTLKLHRRYPKGKNNECIDGCRHMSDEMHRTPNANTRDCGGWDWLRGMVPNDAFDRHLAELMKKEEMREAEAEQAAKRIKTRKEVAATAHV